MPQKLLQKKDMMPSVPCMKCYMCTAAIDKLTAALVLPCQSIAKLCAAQHMFWMFSAGLPVGALQFARMPCQLNYAWPRDAIQYSRTAPGKAQRS